MPQDRDLPGTIERSPKKARETYQKTHDSAVETYGEGERAHRTAYASLKHSYRKVGDHWELKPHKGPSEPQAARGGRRALEHPAETFGGIDLYGSTKAELLDQARKAGVRGRSRMDKAELARAIARKQ